MLPKVHRLQKKKDIELVIRKGESIKHDMLILILLTNHVKENRCGFVVSKKVSRKANHRNTITSKL